MVRFMIALCIFMACLVVAAKAEEAPSSAPSPLAPSPATSCPSIIYDMLDCIPFVSDGSKDKKPTASCCTGFKRVLTTGGKCICEALKSSAELGIDVNFTKADTLPYACGLPIPLISCDVSPSPAPGKSPGTAPRRAPIMPPTIAPAKPPSPPSNGAPSPNTAKAPAPAGAPRSSLPPNEAPSTNTAKAPAPAGAPRSSPPSSDGEGDAKPAPAPDVSSGNSMSACFFVLIISMLVASFSNVSV